MKASILIVDDDIAQSELLGGFLRKKGYKTTVLQDPKKVFELLRTQGFDLLITDYGMPGMTGLELLKETRAFNPLLPVIMVTAYGTVETAVEAMKSGGSEFLSKPIDLKDLLNLVEVCIDKKSVAEETQQLQETLSETTLFKNIIGNSEKMREVTSLVARVAESNATAIIFGESGTGKELIAKALHYASLRKEKPFVKINCAALPETLLESELFGHIKGSFTGAIGDRKGKFEEANTGTIFLDEIGDITLTTQTKLLRVLQEREFERVGNNQTVKVDIRIVAATNKDLVEAVKEKEFREDLYYRLSVVPIFLPPLRERKEDIILLAEHFLKIYTDRNEKKLQGFSKEARSALMRYSYPGNIRELENIIERAIVICRGEWIAEKDLPVSMMATTGSPKEEKSSSLDRRIELMPLAEAENLLIEMALEKHNNVQTRAAKELGISERALRYKLKSKNLKKEKPLDE